MKREDTDTERGLVILSFGINFVDWLNKESKLSMMHYSKRDRGRLVLEFMQAHSGKRNVFQQSTEIAARLGVPLGRPNNPDESLKRVATKIVDFMNFDISMKEVQKVYIQPITDILNEESILEASQGIFHDS